MTSLRQYSYVCAEAEESAAGATDFPARPWRRISGSVEQIRRVIYDRALDRQHLDLPRCRIADGSIEVAGRSRQFEGLATPLIVGDICRLMKTCTWLRGDLNLRARFIDVVAVDSRIKKPGNPFRLPGFFHHLGCGDRI
jgi:hypothetical protein